MTYKHDPMKKELGKLAVIMRPRPDNEAFTFVGTRQTSSYRVSSEPNAAVNDYFDGRISQHATLSTSG